MTTIYKTTINNRDVFFASGEAADEVDMALGANVLPIPLYETADEYFAGEAERKLTQAEIKALRRKVRRDAGLPEEEEAGRE